MNTPPTPREPSPVRGQGMWINEACDRFEDAWAKADRPRIEDHLGDLPELGRSLLLRELVLLDIHYRREAGETPQATEYAQRFSELDVPWLTAALVVVPGDEAGRDPNSTVTPDPGGAQPAEPERLPALAGFEVLGILGRGGMGVVYKARHTKLNRIVAVKMILAGDHASAQERARFRREAEASAQLQHPNIVQVFEVNEQDGRPYLVLEYVDGGSLQQRLNGTPWPAEPAAALLQTVARAVEHAHQRGIVHRDLKPGNILLMSGADSPADTTHQAPRTTDQPKITDFGLAKFLDAETAQTRSGALLGTPGYMAPEQAEGRREAVGPAVDVYALGSILYECLAGRPPFKAETPLDTILYMLNYEPIPLSRLNPKVPRDLETICLKCLARTPQERYPTAAALADDLERFLHDHPIRARPSSGAEKAWRWCRRKPVVAGLLALTTVLAVLLVVVAGTGFLATKQALDRESAERRVAEEERERARQARDVAIQQRDRITKNLYTAHMRLAYEALQQRQIARVSELLDLYGARSDLHHLTGWEWCYLQAACRLEVVRTWAVVHPQAVAWSPDGQELAAADTEGVIHIWKTATGEEIHCLRGHQGPVRALACSTDGQWLVSGGQDGSVKIWNWATGALLRSLELHQTPVVGVALHAEKQAVASAGADGTLHLGNLEGQSRFRVQHGSKVQGLDWSPDGRWLATAGNDRRIKVWDAANGTALATLEYKLERPLAVAWSPDSSKLAAQGWGGPKVWDITTRQEILSLYKADFAGRTLHWSPDGQSLALGCDDWTVKVLDVATHKPLRTLGNHTNWIEMVRWAASGKQLASVSRDHTVKIQDVAADEGITRLAGHPKSVWALAWSPDGRKLATGGDDKSFTVWDVAARKAAGTVEGLPGVVRALAWNPSGSQVAAAIYGGGVQVWDPGQRKPQVVLQGIKAFPAGVAWSLDGTKLFSASWDGTVKTHQAVTGELRQTVPAHRGRLSCAVLSPDGHYLATAAADNLVRIWYAATGRLARVLSGHAGEVTRVTWSPDGLRLASASVDGTVMLWEVAASRALQTLRGHTSMVFSVDWSPDGRRLASGGYDHSIRIWDPVSGQNLLTLRPGAGPILVLAWHPGGRSLAAGSSEGTVKIWDASLGFQEHRPPPLAVTEEEVSSKAQLWVDALKDALPTPEAVVAQLQKDNTLPQAVRQAAIARALQGLAQDTPGQAVDLRPSFANWGLAPKAQGSRKTCSVCVVTGALEFALARSRGHGESLSVEFLNWACHQVLGNQTEDRGQFFHDLLQGFSQHGICPEKDWPYQARFDGQRHPSAAAREAAAANRKAGVRIHWLRPWHMALGLEDQHLADIKRILKQGWPVCAGSEHSLLLVGYREDPTQPGGGVFFAADSANGAFVEVSYEHVKTKMNDLLWIESVIRGQ